MTLVRGRSNNPDLTQLGHMIHLALFALRAQGYWEYVQSKSNWADDINGLGIQDPLRVQHWSLKLTARSFPAAFSGAYLSL